MEWGNDTKKIKNFNKSAISKIPVIIFQGNKNQNIGEGGYSYPNDRSIWTTSDLVVFRGIFRIEENLDDPDNYTLTKLFDQYYFTVPERKKNL